MSSRFPLFSTTLFFALALGAACSSVRQSMREVGRALHMIDDPRPDVHRTAVLQTPKELREGLSDLDQMLYESALGKFRSFLAKEPTSPWTQVTTYQIGRALEALSRWGEAADEYRRVIAATEGQAPRLQAAALFRLSFCHEALGDDQRTLASLHDLLARSTALPAEVGNAELPARLAGAYARVGNFEKAIEFYRKAEAGMNRLQSERGEKEKIPDWLPRTLYSMGATPNRQVGWEDFETALRPLARSQIYLLRAAELGASPESERAAKDLIAIYGRLWTVIENPPEFKASEPVLARRSVQDLQLARAELLEETWRELRARALATEPKHGSVSSKEILNFGDALEKKILALFRRRPPGEGPTNESRARREAIRGRTLITDESLEKKFLRSSRGAPKRQDSSPTMDPNL